MLRVGPAGLSIDQPGRPSIAIHPLWLRERSQHPAFRDRRTAQRLYNPTDLDPDLAIVSVAMQGNDSVAISFSDGHEAVFSAAAILAECDQQIDGGLPDPMPWTGSPGDLPVFDWMPDPGAPALLAMVERFLIDGFVSLRGVPARNKAVLDVARIFGFPRETNFGVLFDVRSTPDADDLAYTALALDPHTDNPYRLPVPGIQLLHCLANDTPGGLSILVDGLAVAEALRVEDPDAFAILSRVPVRFRYADPQTELVADAPLIARDLAGRFEAIHYSPRLDFVPLLPQDELAGFYAARRVLDRMLRSDRFQLRFRLDDGDLVMFDNRRLLHGRTAFDPGKGLRHLQGCYIDGDGPRSLYRVLRRHLKGDDAG